MKAAAIFLLGGALVAMGLSSILRSSKASDPKASEAAPVEWSVSNAYASDHTLIKGAMVASAPAIGTGGEIQVACSQGFTAVYVTPASAPDPEAGTRTFTVIRKLDAGPAIAEHALKVGRRLIVGQREFAASLAAGRHLTIKTTPLLEREMATDEFDLRGLVGALSQMKDVCGAI